MSCEILAVIQVILSRLSLNYTVRTCLTDQKASPRGAVNHHAVPALFLAEALPECCAPTPLTPQLQCHALSPVVSDPHDTSLLVQVCCPPKLLHHYVGHWVPRYH